MKLYCLVNRSLSPIQKGIQAAHAIAELSLNNLARKDYKKWAKKYKTIVILDGGSSRSQPSNLGDLEKYCDFLFKNGIIYEPFWEENLDSCLTAVAFILPEEFYMDYSEIDCYPDFGIEEEDYDRKREVSRFIRQFRTAK